MNRPFWVEVGLLGIKTRNAAMTWFILSLICAALIALLITVVGNILLEVPLIWALAFGLALGGLFSLASVWYWMCIRWMDKRGGWGPQPGAYDYRNQRPYDYRNRMN